VQLIQSRPDDVLDADAMQRFGAAQQVFAQKWRDADPLKTSRRALESVKMWGMTGSDENHHKAAQARFVQLTEQRATSLRTKFYGAPKLLDDAMDYYRTVNTEDPTSLEGQLRAIRSQALQLANQANNKQRYMLAAEYYDVAGEDAKADAARARQQQQAQKRNKSSADNLEKELGL
jgi:hypothetical protein